MRAYDMCEFVDAGHYQEELSIGLPPASEIRRGLTAMGRSNSGVRYPDHGKFWVECSLGQAEDVSIKHIDASCGNAVGRGNVGEA